MVSFVNRNSYVLFIYPWNHLWFHVIIVIHICWFFCCPTDFSSSNTFFSLNSIWIRAPANLLQTGWLVWARAQNAGPATTRFPGPSARLNSGSCSCWASGRFTNTEQVDVAKVLSRISLSEFYGVWAESERGHNVECSSRWVLQNNVKLWKCQEYAIARTNYGSM